MSQRKPFEFLDPELKALDPRKLLKRDDYKEKVKTNLERLHTNNCDLYFLKNLSYMTTKHIIIYTK